MLGALHGKLSDEKLRKERGVHKLDLSAFYKVTYGLYIVSSIHQEKAAGCVVNTLVQVTAEPAKMAVAISKKNTTCAVLEQSGVFAAVALTQDTKQELLKVFGFQSSAKIDKFSGISVGIDKNGIPYPMENIAARFSCRVVDRLDLGTHFLFVGEAEEAEIICEDPLLTYEHYRLIRKGGTPKNAPSYQKPLPKRKMGYRCTACGYLLETDTLPSDFVCPVCGVGADKFEQLK